MIKLIINDWIINRIALAAELSSVCVTVLGSSWTHFVPYRL